MAVRFRAKFGRDVMTELVGWRKYGHNELDEPRITNPKLYKHVDNTTPTPDVWCSQLRGWSILRLFEISPCIFDVYFILRDLSGQIFTKMTQKLAE